MRRNVLALAEAENRRLWQTRVRCSMLADPDGKPYGVPLDSALRNNILYFHGVREGASEPIIGGHVID